jgi:hypothetical protein
VGVLVNSELSHRYAIYGLTVLTNFPLTLPYDVGCGNADRVVEFELVSPNNFSAMGPSLAHNDDEWFQQVVLADGAIYMRWANLFEFVVAANGRRVKCTKLSEATIESFEAYLITFAISAALIQQGEEPLHSTVVATDRGVVGLLGPSGAGKSTLAAFLIERGGRLVTDDMLRLEFRGGVAMAFPGQSRLKLLKDSAEKILKRSENCGQFNRITEKFIFQLAPVAMRDYPQSLSALFYLEAPPKHIDPNSISIERLSGVSLFKAIAESTMESRLDATDRLERQFHFAERIANTIPLYKLVYRRDYDLLDKVADLIDKTISQ